MKRYIWIVPAVALVVVALFMASRRFTAASGQADQATTSLNGGEPSPKFLTGASTRGVVFKTAALNSDGSRFACFGCTNTIHLGPGEYEIDFDHNVQAVNGWSRWVQVDTLQTGSIDNRACSTADRAGNTFGVYVQCYNGSGTFIDTSFFLFVAR
jgi:hypothetical protein